MKNSNVVMLAKYVFVGFCTYATDIIIYALILVSSNNAYIIATILSSTMAMAISYLLNNFWTFKKSKITARSIVRYLSAHGFNVMISLLLLYWLIDCINFQKVISKGIVSLISCSWNFWIAKKFIYRN